MHKCIKKLTCIDVQIKNTEAKNLGGVDHLV